MQRSRSRDADPAEKSRRPDCEESGPPYSIWMDGWMDGLTLTPGMEHRAQHTCTPRNTRHTLGAHLKARRVHRIEVACRPARTDAHADLGFENPPPDDVHVGGCVGPSWGREMVEDDALARGCTGCSSQRQRAPRRLRRRREVPDNEGADVFCAHGARPGRTCTTRRPPSAVDA